MAGNVGVPQAPAMKKAPTTSVGAIGSGNNQVLIQQIDELKLQNSTLEKERDFYFGKLRDIEILLQARGGEQNEDPIAQDILKILYASEEEKVQVNSDGSLQITSSSGAKL